MTPSERPARGRARTRAGSPVARVAPIALAAALALQALQAGCAAMGPGSLGGLPTGAAPSPSAVARLLAARDEALSSFRAQARLEYRSEEQSFRSSQLVVVRAPASARIDVMHPFGVSYSVATDGLVLTAFDRRRRVYYRGRAQPESFRRFIGIPMTAADFAALLRGLPPGLGQSRWSAAEAVDGGWRMTRRLGSGGTLELVVAAETFDPVRVRISGDPGGREVDATYGDFQDVGGTAVPHRIQASFADGGRLELEYRSVQKDVVLPEAAFVLPQPEGARFVDVDLAGFDVEPVGEAAGTPVPAPGDGAPPKGADPGETGTDDDAGPADEEADGRGEPAEDAKPDAT